MSKEKLGDNWKVTKRGDQDVGDSAETYTFLGKILVKMIGVDEVRVLTRKHAVELRQLLKDLPTYYAKSPADWALSFVQPAIISID